MKSWIQEFKEFIDRGTWSNSPFAFVLAAAFGLVVKAIVDGVIMPIIAAIFGQPNFDAITIDLGDGVILIGTAITAIVNFLIIVFVCFLIVKAYNAMKGPVDEDDGPSEVDLLMEIRDELRSRSS